MTKTDESIGGYNDVDDGENWGALSFGERDGGLLPTFQQMDDIMFDFEFFQQEEKEESRKDAWWAKAREKIRKRKKNREIVPRSRSIKDGFAIDAKILLQANSSKQLRKVKSVDALLNSMRKSKSYVVTPFSSKFSINAAAHQTCAPQNDATTNMPSLFGETGDSLLPELNLPPLDLDYHHQGIKLEPTPSSESLLSTSSSLSSYSSSSSLCSSSSLSSSSSSSSSSCSSPTLSATTPATKKRQSAEVDESSPQLKRLNSKSLPCDIPVKVSLLESVVPSLSPSSTASSPSPHMEDVHFNPHSEKTKEDTKNNKDDRYQNEQSPDQTQTPNDHNDGDDVPANEVMKQSLRLRNMYFFI